jgi:hypothetical protein
VRQYCLIVCFLIFGILFVPLSTAAQPSSQSSPNTPPRSKSRDANSAVRQSAILVLDSAIDELREVEDIQARVSMTETIVKLLAKSKHEHCRNMLDSLFDNALRLQKADSSDRAGGSNTDSILQKIIQIAAQLDRKLAQSYIDRYTVKEDRNGGEPSTSAKNSPRMAVLYIQLATQLFEKDLTLALSMAMRSLTIAVVPDTLVFLATLRKKDIVHANNFFTAALNSVKMRQGTDVNELLLLYAYVFSPTRIPVVTSQGLGIYSVPAYLGIAGDYAADPALARQYLSITTQVLLDAERYYPGNVERLTAGVVGDFCLVSIMEGQAESYLPTLAQTLSTQRHVLAGYLQPDGRAGLASSIDRWNTMPNGLNLAGKETVAAVDYLLQRADQVSDPKKKDQLYYRAAMIAASTRGSDAAFEIIDKVSSEYREEAKQFIAFDIAVKSARSHQLEEAERLAQRDHDLTRRAYVFTLIASSLLDDKSRDAVRATEFLNEVDRLVSKLDNDAERVAVLFGGAAVASRLDAIRASEFLRAAIRIANKTQGFTGDTRIPRGLNIGGFLFAYTMYDDEFTLAEAISRVGANDFNETIVVIREFKNTLPRLRATVALCDGILSNTSIRSKAHASDGIP